MIPVMVMRNKTNPVRYLALNVDVGDWDDENLDVTIQNIQNGYMIVRNDLSVPTITDFEEHKFLHAEHKRLLTKIRRCSMHRVGF